MARLQRKTEHSEPELPEAGALNETQKVIAVPFDGDVQVFQTVHDSAPVPLNCVVICLHSFQ